MLEYQQPLHRVARKIWRAVALPGVFLILAGRCCRCGARSATIFQGISLLGHLKSKKIAAHRGILQHFAETRC